MRLSYKYRLIVSKNQRKALDKILYLCRFLYNSALEERISFYKKYNKTLSYNKQAGELKGISEILPEYADAYSQILQQTLKQLDVAFQGFFRRLKAGGTPGFPRFKGKDRFHSICFPQVSDDLSKMKGLQKLKNNRLKVFGIPGEIKVKWHRPWKGRCKQVRLKKEGEYYYLILSCENVPRQPLPKTGKEVGIDLGISTFITGDNGLTVHHPQPLKQASNKLRAAQQTLSRKKKGSNNRYRAKLRLAKAHQKISNIRKDFLHKVALQLVKDYDKIILEKLNIAKMLEAKGFEVNNNNITDASWGLLTQYLLYKAERAGKEIILVDPKNTSKTCSCCGSLQEMPLQQRTYSCPNCKLEMDRDLNAARNIKRLGTSLAPPKEDRSLRL